MRNRLPSGVVLIVTTLALAACDKPRIRVYEVAKEDSGENSGPESGPGRAAVRLPAPPEGWEEKDLAGGPRMASFRVPAGEDEPLDVSVTSFPGAAGGLLANVNRWRSEVGEPAVDELALGEVTEKAEVGGRPLFLLNVSNNTTRILGAILPLGGETWFVKMAGSAEGVAKEEGNFREYVLGFEIEGGAPGGTPAPARPEIDYDKPEGWKDEGTTSMRVASFSVEGGDGQSAEISVIPIGGSAGGLLANVNNWRSALQLEPVTEEQLPGLLGGIEGGEHDFKLVDIVSEKPLIGGTRAARMIVAFTKSGEFTWFFKIVGEEKLVAGERPRFVEFVKTARLDPQG